MKRKLVQSIIFAGMFIIPMLNFFEIYFIKGTFISMDIGSLGIADPVMIFQAFFATHSSSGVLFTSIVIPVLLTFFLGRVWCSWGCPYNFLMDLLEKVSFLKKRIRKNQTKLAVNGIKKQTALRRYAVFMLMLLLVGITGVPALHLVSPPSVISSQALLFTQALLAFKITLTVEILLLVVLFIVDIFFSYRFTCRIFCPTGTCLSLLKNKQSLRVSYDGKCIDCNKCGRVCPMGLNPRTDGDNRLCYNCGRCIDNCPDKSLKWGIN